MIQKQHEEEPTAGPVAPGDPRAVGPGQRVPRWSSSNKLQASSAKLGEPQATSVKRQAQRVKRQATSVKLLDHGAWKKFHGPLTEVLY